MPIYSKLLVTYMVFKLTSSLCVLGFTSDNVTIMKSKEIPGHCLDRTTLKVYPYRDLPTTCICHYLSTFSILPSHP